MHALYRPMYACIYDYIHVIVLVNSIKNAYSVLSYNYVGLT